MLKYKVSRQIAAKKEAANEKKSVSVHLLPEQVIWVDLRTETIDPKVCLDTENLNHTILSTGKWLSTGMDFFFQYSIPELPARS